MGIYNERKQIRLTEQNKENLERLSQLINTSVSGIANYVLEMSLKEVEANLNKMPEQLKQTFSEILKQTLTPNKK